MAWTRKSSVPHFRCSVVEHGIDAGDVLDVAGQHQFDAERFRQRLDALAERLALIGEGELGALRGQRLGDAPGDRMIIGDAHDQAALALHQVCMHAPSCPLSASTRIR